MTSLKISKSDFSTTISNINAQFAPVNKELNSASIRLKQLLWKYFRYAQMTSLKFSKFNFYAAVSNIYAQFAPVNRGVNTAYIILQQLFRKYFRYARMISSKFSKFNFTATVDSIYAQFAPVKRGLNSAFIRLQLHFRKYFRYARMTSLKFPKFNFSAAISNIYVQFVSVSRGLYSAYLTYKQLFESTSGMREWRHLKLKYNFSAAIGNIQSSWKVSVRRFWLTKFHSDWQKFELFSMYFSVRTDRIFKIKENDRQVRKLFNISEYLCACCANEQRTKLGIFDVKKPFSKVLPVCANDVIHIWNDHWILRCF